jgi:hypothetical protein
MGDTLSIDFLRRENLLAAQGPLMNLQSARYPLERYFERVQGEGDKIQIRVRKIPDIVSPVATPDGPAHLIKDGTLDVIEVNPIRVRPMKKWENSDISLFAQFDEIVQTTSNAMSSPLAAKAARKLRAGLIEILKRIRTTMHDAYAGALLGSYTYRIGLVEVTVDYGHPALTAPTTVWTNAGATIIADVYGWQQEFLDQSDGAPITHAFYNGRAWSKYFVGNTDFQTWLAASPKLAESFGIKGSQPEIVTDGEGTFTDPIFGFTWVNVAGPHIKAGTSQDRWPVEKIAFASLNQGDESEPTLQHAMVQDRYNPEARINWKSWEEDEPERTYTRGADNGAAVVTLPGRVQVVDVEEEA